MPEICWMDTKNDVLENVCPETDMAIGGVSMLILGGVIDIEMFGFVESSYK